MQEAFGGSFLLKLFMVFFIIYVTFIGVALNFAKIYRIKNNVINILEQGQFDGSDNDPALVEMANYLASVPYNVTVQDISNFCEKNNDVNDVVSNKSGICIRKRGDDSKPYYKVSVYYVARFPFFNLNLPIVASGETKVIVLKKLKGD